MTIDDVLFVTSAHHLHGGCNKSQNIL